MSELSAVRDAAVTDRIRLAGSACSSDRDLAARQLLYPWQMPSYDLPGTITGQGPERVIAHMASYRARADQHHGPFGATIERARAILVDHISQYGAFEVMCLGGTLVCGR
ncbi:hypothetical protein [Streptomyces sp. SAS_270]|uniref:hypothetical protein n=1 Tax=Streptomyces sp. SAS_270 TaxID=3412748 RepID=UPI00403C7614